jgi:hypothetical protein
MAPVISLLTAIERHDVAALTHVIEHEEMSPENLAYEEAVTLWDAGWHAWSADDSVGNLTWRAGEEGDAWPQLWRITLGEFLHVLHSTFPVLPGVAAWAELQDVEEE